MEWTDIQAYSIRMTRFGLHSEAKEPVKMSGQVFFTSWFYFCRKLECMEKNEKRRKWQERRLNMTRKAGDALADFPQIFTFNSCIYNQKFYHI